ncbi:MAG: hypothetical protein WC326_13890 [Candidatus Delongbacteria bacterium]
MNSSTDPTESRDFVSLETAISLSFDYLKQLTTLALAAAGGLVTLVQFIEGDRNFHLKVILAVSALFLSAFVAFITQYSLVDRISLQHKLLRKTEITSYSHDKAMKAERIYTLTALSLLGLGTGMALQAILNAGV